MDHKDESVYDVLAIGNALVDVIIPSTEELLHRHGLAKGGMALASWEQICWLHETVAQATLIGGGSVANTAVGVASFGGAAAFVGRVGADMLGEAFGHDIDSAGVDFVPLPTLDNIATGRCHVIVTPDGERTMATYLGAAQHLQAEDVTPELVASAHVTYLEGYLFDAPSAQKAFRRAAQLALDTGRDIALTLSDVFCVERHRDELVDYVRNDVDILLANEHELRALYQTDDLGHALASAVRECRIVAVTRGADGAIIARADDTHHIEAHPVPGNVVDTTGAGDLFAAGFLYGLTHGHSLDASGRLGALAAAEVISHTGARPTVALADLAESAVQTDGNR